MRTINPEDPLPTGKNIGIVVGSITGITAEHYWEIGAVPYRKTDGSITGWFESASKLTTAFWYTHSMTPGYPGPDPGLEEALGRVFAVALPSGKYALYPSGNKNEDPLIKIPPATFEVFPGEVKYIGRIKLRGCIYTPKNRRVWRGYINASVPSVQNRWDMDRDLLHWKYPALRGRNIVVSPVDDRVWKGLEDILESQLETNCRPG